MKKLFLIGLLMVSILVINACDMGQEIGYIKTPKLVNGTENETSAPALRIVTPEVREIGSNPIIIEKMYLDNQLKALQLQHIIGEATLSEYLEVREEAINDNNDPNFQEDIAINSEDINTPLKSAQLDYILGKIRLDEYLEKERGILG